MADGLCTEDPVGTLIEKTIVKDYDSLECVNDLSCENVKSFYIDSDSGKLCGPVCGAVGSAEGKLEGFLHLPCSPTMAGDEDCRKKRCADRYDSSESSDRYGHTKKPPNTRSSPSMHQTMHRQNILTRPMVIVEVFSLHLHRPKTLLKH